MEDEQETLFRNQHRELLEELKLQREEIERLNREKQVSTFNEHLRRKSLRDMSFRQNRE